MSTKEVLLDRVSYIFFVLTVGEFNVNFYVGHSKGKCRLLSPNAFLKKNKYERTERRRRKERKKERKEVHFRKPDRVRGIFRKERLRTRISYESTRLNRFVCMYMML